MRRRTQRWPAAVPSSRSATARRRGRCSAAYRRCSGTARPGRAPWSGSEVRERARARGGTCLLPPRGARLGSPRCARAASPGGRGRGAPPGASRPGLPTPPRLCARSGAWAAPRAAGPEAQRFTEGALRSRERGRGAASPAAAAPGPGADRPPSGRGWEERCAGSEELAWAAAKGRGRRGRCPRGTGLAPPAGRAWVTVLHERDAVAPGGRLWPF